MKVLSAQQVRDADQFTIANEPVASIDLMERASQAFVDRFVQYYDCEIPVYVFAGVGNNGGDGLAVARLLANKNFSIKVYVLGDTTRATTDFEINRKRHPTSIVSIKNATDFPEVKEKSVVIDALFGSGLSRPLEGLVAEVVGWINGLDAIRVALDIPSGLFADELLPPKTIAIKAHRTITFQTPKLTFFQPEMSAYVGRWTVVDIGLSKDFIERQAGDFYFTNREDLNGLLVERDTFLHKGGAGSVQIWAGSTGKMGAAQLAARACLRSGVGLLFMKSPRCGTAILQVGVPEAMVIQDPGEDHIQSPDFYEDVDVVAFGPGLGTAEQTSRAVEEFLKNYRRAPLVIDADGINILSKNQELLTLLPEGTILTPHPGELRRLVGPWKNDFHKLELLRALCSRYQINVVLKGAFSAVVLADGSVHFNSTGNPGMATGGSGDVLCGVVAGLVAQGLKPGDALRLAVYVHGLAGDLAKKENGELSLTAGDLIDFLPKAFQAL